MKPIKSWFANGLLIALLLPPTIHAASSPELIFRIHLSDSVRTSPLTGRLFLYVSDNIEETPLGVSRFNGYTFAMDIEELEPGDTADINVGTMGASQQSLSDIPDGVYVVQAVVNVYTQFSRSDGHTVWLPAIQWVRANIRNKTGNLYSKPIKVNLDSQQGYVHDIVLSEILPDLPDPEDTDLVRRVKIQSKALTEFWGQPVYIGAVIHLPKGYMEHPEIHYPVVYRPGGGRLRAFREGQPLYEHWMSDDFPHVILVAAHMPAHYFRNGHAVNSSNMGPWDDAFMDELVPFIESEFRIIREPWARTLSGTSTGGWIVLALQLFHPTFFGGMWCKNPDPVDFRRFGLVNIYEDANAYEVRPGRERPVRRQVSGQPTLTIREEVREDLLYGSRGRSGRQLEAYHALFGSVGADGYPKPLWDAETGVIDTAVIAHWRKYDLLQYLKENWSRIGPDIVGKLHFSRGDMDNYYFNEALYGVEGFLESRSDPYYAGEFVWGRPRKGHGWIPERWKDDKLYRFIANYITRVAPPSADTKSWKY